MAEKEKLPKFYSLPELVDSLSVSKDFLYKLIKSGKIEAYKAGNRWRIPASELPKIIRKANEPEEKEQ